MKRLIVLVLALGLSGCATFNPFGSVANPVGTQSLAATESAYGVALSAALAYKSLPLCKTGTTISLNNVCARRSVIVQLQNADRYAHAQILVARQFVKNNPTLDASAILTTAQNAVAAFKSAETANGVQ